MTRSCADVGLEGLHQHRAPRSRRSRRGRAPWVLENFMTVDTVDAVDRQMSKNVNCLSSRWQHIDKCLARMKTATWGFLFSHLSNETELGAEISGWSINVEY